MDTYRGTQKNSEIHVGEHEVAEVENAIKSVVKKRRIHLASGVVYVTDLCQCLRRTFYEYVSGYTKTKAMVAGEVLHSEVLPAVASLLEDEHDVEVEKSVSKTVETRCMIVTLYGRIDMLIDGVPMELKFSNRIMDHHMLQAEYYAWMLGVDRYMVCIVTDDGEVKCKMFRRHIPNEKLVERIDTLMCSIMDGNPPKPEKGIWCSNCPFRSMCAASKKLSDYLV